MEEIGQNPLFTETSQRGDAVQEQKPSEPVKQKPSESTKPQPQQSGDTLLMSALAPKSGLPRRLRLRRAHRIAPPLLRPRGSSWRVRLLRRRKPSARAFDLRPRKRAESGGLIAGLSRRRGARGRRCLRVQVRRARRQRAGADNDGPRRQHRRLRLRRLRERDASCSRCGGADPLE